jgi:hypothetical protein
MTNLEIVRSKIAAKPDLKWWWNVYHRLSKESEEQTAARWLLELNWRLNK